MFRFILDNFNPLSSFLPIASRATSIKWKLSTRKIISISGIKEFPHILNSYSEDKELKQLLITEVVHQELYLKTKNCIAKYRALRNNQESAFIMVFAKNNENESPGILIQLYLNPENDCGILSIYRQDGFPKLNERLVLFIDLKGDFKGRVSFVTSLDEKCKVDLVYNEFNILQLLTKGFTSEEIATQLKISKYTVDDNRQNMLNKFNAKNTFQLIYHAQQEGYI